MVLTLIAADGDNLITVTNNDTVTKLVVHDTASVTLMSSYVSGLCFDRVPTLHGRDFTLDAGAALGVYCFAPFRDCDAHGLAAFEAHNHKVACDDSEERAVVSQNALELSTVSEFSCTAEKDQWVVQINPVMVCTTLLFCTIFFALTLHCSMLQPYLWAKGQPSFSLSLPLSVLYSTK